MLGMDVKRSAAGIAVLTIAALSGCQTEIRQVDLGELPTPVRIRTATWDVNGFRLADGRKDVAAFAKVLADARVTFAALMGLDQKSAAADMEAIASATGLHASVGNGVALLSSVKPEDSWPEKDHLVVELPDYSIAVVDFGGDPGLERAERILRTCGRGKLAFFCANPYFKKGTEVFESYDKYYRTIADGIGVVRTWGAGGCTFDGEESLGGAEFKSSAHFVVVKD